MKTRNQKTLDIQHTQFMDRFKKNQMTLTNLQNTINSTKEEIAVLENEEVKDYDKIIKLKDDMIDMNIQCKRLQNEMDEHNYFLNNANTLYSYYNLVENSQHNKNKHIFESEDASKSSILSYFSQDNGLETTIDTRGNLLEKYMLETDNNYIKTTTNDVSKCEHCDSRDITLMLSDGYQYCNSCNTISHLVTDHDKPSYRDPPKEISYFAYKRINHYSESIEWVFLMLLIFM